MRKKQGMILFVTLSFLTILSGVIFLQRFLVFTQIAQATEILKGRLYAWSYAVSCSNWAGFLVKLDDSVTYDNIVDSGNNTLYFDQGICRVLSISKNTKTIFSEGTYRNNLNSSSNTYREEHILQY